MIAIIILCMLVVVIVYSIYMSFYNIDRAAEQSRDNGNVCDAWCRTAISNHDYINSKTSVPTTAVWAEIDVLRENLFGQLNSLASWFVPIDKASHVWSPETSEAVAAYNKAISQ